MSYSVELTKEAITDLEVLASTTQERILRKIYEIRGKIKL
ncbi:type II toxin-antitoxin system RelE family toxin [Nostoc sp.]